MNESRTAACDGVWVVIPALNEAATIAAIVRECAARAEGVIVVDDGSSDGTAERAQAAGAHVVRHAATAGKGASLADGIRAALASGAIRIATLDGDGQHRPEDLPRLLALAAAEPDAVVIGSRRADGAQAPRARFVANRVADFWIGWAARQPVSDSQSGFRVYPADLLRLLLDRPRLASGFVFESEMLIEAGRQGSRILAAPIPSIYGRPDQRASYFRPVRDITRIVLMVAGKLLARRMDVGGLRLSLRPPPPAGPARRSGRHPAGTPDRTGIRGDSGNGTPPDG